MSFQAMTSVPDQFRILVQQSGCLAASILDEAATGDVTAVFRSSFYIRTQRGFVCVGCGGMQAAALNVVSSAPADTDWIASGLTCGTNVRISNGEMRIGQHLSFLYSDADIWLPPPPRKRLEAADIACGLEIVREMYVDRLPCEGLARFIEPGFTPAESDIVCRHAKAPLTHFRSFLIRAFSGFANADQDGIEALAGLGPGLTPSGDDLLGAAMITLHALGRTDICRAVWSRVEPVATRASNAISLAHLDAASQGLGGENVHDVLAAVMSGDREAIKRAVARSDDVGHTSGWDAITGVVLTLDAWTQAHARSMKN